LLPATKVCLFTKKGKGVSAAASFVELNKDESAHTGKSTGTIQCAGKSPSIRKEKPESKLGYRRRKGNRVAYFLQEKKKVFFQGVCGGEIVGALKRTWEQLQTKRWKRKRYAFPRTIVIGDEMVTEGTGKATHAWGTIAEPLLLTDALFN